MRNLSSQSRPASAHAPRVVRQAIRAPAAGLTSPDRRSAQTKQHSTRPLHRVGLGTGTTSLRAPDLCNLTESPLSVHGKLLLPSKVKAREAISPVVVTLVACSSPREWRPLAPRRL